MTLGGFISHMTGVAIAAKSGNREAMERACRVVEDAAKAEIGTYQNGAGPFAAWAELADSTKDDRVSKGFSENDPGLRTGEMRDSIKHFAENTEGAVGSDDEKLVWFELGTSKQPPRSVLGIAAVRNTEKVARILGEGFVQHLLGGRKPMRISDE